MATTLPDIPKSAHFVGIGGAGMSGIALVLHERGCKVTGSDLKQSHYVRELTDAGIEITVGHKAETVDAVKPEVIVRSTAIPDTNPEIVRAKELGIDIWPRAKMLSALSKGARTIAIAGTHGKTTTSSLTAMMLDHMGEDPSFLIGGIVEAYNTNGKNGKSDLFVAEADESDGSFLFLDPSIVVITNIEADHLDHYGTLENIERTFVKFMSSVGDDGTIIACGENPHVLELAHETGQKVLSYGFDSSCDFVVSAKPSTHTLISEFSIEAPDGNSYDVTLHSNPGKHNMLNATASLAVAYVLGKDLTKAATALSEFKGVRRRFTHVGDVSGVCVVDDYGHHPTEIHATISAAKNLNFKRVLVVFQPHRYSRTKLLASQFATAFAGADKLYVMDVFGAGEAPIPGVSGETIEKEVLESASVADVCYVPSKFDLLEKLVADTQEGDLLLTMGAGDVTEIGPNFMKLKAQG